jgi:hypothetical protein
MATTTRRNGARQVVCTDSGLPARSYTPAGPTPSRPTPPQQRSDASRPPSQPGRTVHVGICGCRRAATAGPGRAERVPRSTGRVLASDSSRRGARLVTGRSLGESRPAGRVGEPACRRDTNHGSCGCRHLGPEPWNCRDLSVHRFSAFRTGFRPDVSQMCHGIASQPERCGSVATSLARTTPGVPCGPSRIPLRFGSPSDKSGIRVSPPRSRQDRRGGQSSAFCRIVSTAPNSRSSSSSSKRISGPSGARSAKGAS